MAQARRYHLVGTTEYAKLHGISERTARRRIQNVAGAERTAHGWRVPVTNTEYSAITGKSARATRRTGILAEGPTDPQLRSAMPGVSRRTMAHTLVPTRVHPGGIVHPSWNYQYQGWAIIQFLSSMDTITVYTSVLPSSFPFTLVDLDLAIREDIERRFMRSPIQIKRTGPVLKNCYRRS